METNDLWKRKGPSFNPQDVLYTRDEMVWIISTMTCLNGIWCVNEVLRRTSFREFECKFISRDKLWIAVLCWRGSVHVRFLFEFWLRSRSPFWISFFFYFLSRVSVVFLWLHLVIGEKFRVKFRTYNPMWAMFSPLLLLIIVIIVGHTVIPNAKSFGPLIGRRDFLQVAKKWRFTCSFHLSWIDR